MIKSRYLFIGAILLLVFFALSGCRVYNYAVITQSSFKDISPKREQEILGNSIIGNEDLWEYSFTYTTTSIGTSNIEYLNIPEPDFVSQMISSGNPSAYVLVWRRNDEQKYYMEYEYTCWVDMNTISKDDFIDALDNLGITVTYVDEEGVEHTLENQFELQD